MILIAAHPAPVVRIPIRKRVERLDWELTRTAIEIPEAAAHETYPDDPDLLGGPQDRDGRIPIMHGGRLYAPMAHGGRNANLADLATLVEGREVEGAGNAEWQYWMAPYLRGTPLTAPFRKIERTGYPKPDHRGGDLGFHRLVRSHGGLMAAAAVRDMGREWFLIVDGVPHVRVVPLATADTGLFDARVTVMERFRIDGLRNLPATPGQVHAFVDAVRPHWHTDRGFDPPQGFRSWMDLPPTVFGDRALTLVANELPFLVRHGQGHRDWAEKYPDRVAAMEALELDGLARSITGDDVETTIRACAVKLRDQIAVSRHSTTGANEAALRVIETLYLPAFLPPLDDVDAEALSSLAL
jgi:hypothetical protein